MTEEMIEETPEQIEARVAKMQADAAAFWAANARPTTPIRRKAKRPASDADYCPKCRRTGCGGC